MCTNAMTVPMPDARSDAASAFRAATVSSIDMTRRFPRPPAVTSSGASGLIAPVTPSRTPSNVVNSVERRNHSGVTPPGFRRFTAT